MKGFIIATSLFISLLICIFINYNYVNTVHTTMNEMVTLLSEKPCEENVAIIQNLQLYWENKSVILSISVSFREIDNLTNAIDSLYASNKSNNNVQFSIQKELLKNAINKYVKKDFEEVQNG